MHPIGRAVVEVGVAADNKEPTMNTNTKTRRPFSQHEHLGAGALINQAQRDLTAVALALQEAYGRAAGSPLLRLADRIDSLKSPLDSIVCRETPSDIHVLEGDVRVTAVYYGWANEPPRTTYREHLAQTAQTLLATRR
jgi:hypothetical protein